MRRVLVTGATGFIGRAVVRALESRGHEVVPAGSEIDLLTGDGPARLVRGAGPVDSLVHLAWYTEHGRYWDAEENLRWVGASLLLLDEFARAGGRRAVVAGTSAEYAWGGTDRLSETESELRPATLYGAAKDALRRVAEPWARARGVSLAWGRVFFAFGPGEPPERLVPSVVLRVLAGEEAPIGDGSLERDFLYVDDLGAAFAALLESEATGAVDLGSGVAVTVGEIAELAAAAAGAPQLLRVGGVPGRPGDAAVVVPCAQRLRDEVGFVPRVGLEEGMARTIAWWRGQQ